MLHKHDNYIGIKQFVQYIGNIYFIMNNKMILISFDITNNIRRIYDKFLFSKNSDL